MSKDTSSGRAVHDCGPNCRYLRLYEGSQRSLSDMATKQARTLDRVVALRSGVLGLMKQHFAQQYAASERQLGHKLGTRDPDSVVLAFLDAFITQGQLNAARPSVPQPAAPPAGLDDLRAALLAAGMDVGSGPDLAAWARAVRASSPRTPAPAAVPAPAPAPAEQAPPVDDFDSSAWGTDPSMWGSEPYAAPSEPLFGDDYEAASSGSGGAWDLGDLFNNTSSPATTAQDEDLEPEDLIDSLYGSVVASPAPPEPPAPAVSAQPEGPAAPAASSEPPVAVAQQEPAAESKARTARTQSSVVKPQMFPAATVPKPARGKRPATTKVARVSAAAPESSDEGAQQDEGPQVATERFGELLDMVSRPKPVFMSDLVAASGSHGLVNAWEQHFQDQGTASPVRVITPRTHHRARGSLVVPHSEALRNALAAHGNSCWTDCLDDGPDRPRLRGAKLYEAAVLLHRFSDEVVSHKRSAHVLSLRLNTPQGLTGVVMWVGSDSPAGDGRAALTEAVQEMVGDRLVMLAVLTHESGARAVERLASVVSEDAAALGWSPTMPLVASHSWDFATDSGASSLAIL